MAVTVSHGLKEEVETAAEPLTPSERCQLPVGETGGTACGARGERVALNVPAASSQSGLAAGPETPAEGS